MFDYRVNFYKTILNSEGRTLKCLQQGIDVRSDSPSGALVLAEAQIEPTLETDCIEVVPAPHTQDFYETLDECRHGR